MKTVWMVNQYALAPDEPGGTRHASLAKYLPRNGWECCILAGSIVSHRNAQRLSPKESFRLEHKGDCHFLWLRNTPYTRSYLQRVVSMLVFTWRLLTSRGLEELPKPDVIVGSTVHPLAAWAALRLANRYRVPFIFEIRDLWPETLVQTAMLREGSLLTKAMYRLESHLCRHAAKVIYLMRGAGDYLMQKAVPADKLCWIPNGVDLEGFPSIDRQASSTFRFFFLGSIVAIISLDKIIDGWAIVEDRLGPSCPELHLIGDGPLKAPLVEKCRRLDLGHVYFHPSVPKNALPERCRTADAFVLTAQNLPGLYRYGISQNKMYDYLAMKRPVLMFSGLEQNLVTESGAGISVLSFDPQEIADGFMRMAAMPRADLRRMGELGREHVEANYSFEHIAAKLARLMEDVVHPASVGAQVEAERFELTATPVAR